jgi:hypothetical protein
MMRGTEFGGHRAVRINAPGVFSLLHFGVPREAGKKGKWR